MLADANCCGKYPIQLPLAIAFIGGLQLRLARTLVGGERDCSLSEESESESLAPESSDPVISRCGRLEEREEEWGVVG